MAGIYSNCRIRKIIIIISCSKEASDLCRSDREQAVGLWTRSLFPVWHGYLWCTCCMGKSSALLLWEKPGRRPAREFQLSVRESRYISCNLSFRSYCQSRHVVKTELIRDNQSRFLQAVMSPDHWSKTKYQTYPVVCEHQLFKMLNASFRAFCEYIVMWITVSISKYVTISIATSAPFRRFFIY